MITFLKVLLQFFNMNFRFHSILTQPTTTNLALKSNYNINFKTHSINQLKLSSKLGHIHNQSMTRTYLR